MNVSAVIGTWVENQLKPWRSAEVKLDRIMSLGNEKDVFILSFEDGVVSFKEKPSSSKWGPHRAQMYVKFFQEVYAAYCKDINFKLALVASDLSSGPRDAPTFPFQKPKGSSAVLVPDIDFLRYNFYVGPEWVDQVSFKDKSDAAIFVGSTSGAGLITAEKLRNNRVPRINSALNFKGNPRVTFKLPNLCQYENDEVLAQLKELDLGSERISWADQLRRKALVSLDGNGATCSRVVGSLSSNSVLLKYDSPHQLYYFDGLIAGEHYIEIYNDSDVENTLDRMIASPEEFGRIAMQSKMFAEAFLTKAAVYEYTGRLLTSYGQLYQSWKN